MPGDPDHVEYWETREPAKPRSQQRAGSADSLLRGKIAELEAEVVRLRRVARVGREPRQGFGGTIQRLREAKGMSLSDLARASGCGKPLVSRIETSSAPNIELRNLTKLASGLGLRPSEVLAAYESENPQNAASERQPGENGE